MLLVFNIDIFSTTEVKQIVNIFHSQHKLFVKMFIGLFIIFSMTLATIILVFYKLHLNVEELSDIDKVDELVKDNRKQIKKNDNIANTITAIDKIKIALITQRFKLISPPKLVDLQLDFWALSHPLNLVFGIVLGGDSKRRSEQITLFRYVNKTMIESCEKAFNNTNVEFAITPIIVYTGNDIEGLDVPEEIHTIKINDSNFKDNFNSICPANGSNESFDSLVEFSDTLIQFFRQSVEKVGS